jgi:hypothetical protein
MPFPDALQEFQVATSGLSADNGVKSGASVNAVTKSGTNRFSGNGFEFLRDQRFNAPDHFAAFGPDGKQVDDGLRRNQFGGTLGGPIVRDKLFFFGAYQGTFCVRRRRATFRTCRRRRCSRATSRRSPRRRAAGTADQPGAPFVGNRIDPALFSPAALNLVKKLPKTTDPCGEVKWEQPRTRTSIMPITQDRLPGDQRPVVFGRYLGTRSAAPHRGAARRQHPQDVAVGQPQPAPLAWCWVTPR